MRQNGDDHGDHEAFTSDPDDDFIVVRCKRQRISTGGKSNELNLPFEELPNYDALTSEDKISLPLSKVSLNEGRVIEVQNKLEAVIDLKQSVPCHPGDRNRWLHCACSRWVRPPLYNATVRYTVLSNRLKQ